MVRSAGSKNLPRRMARARPTHRTRWRPYSSLPLDAGLVDDGAPLGDVAREQLRELGRRARFRNAAELGDAFLEIRLRDGVDDLPVEERDHLKRRPGRREQGVPAEHLELRHPGLARG